MTTEELEGKEAFVKRLDGTFDKFESIVLMREDLYKLQGAVQQLQDSGLRYRTILILLKHYTGLPQKTIQKVLNGLKDIPEVYFEEE